MKHRSKVSRHNEGYTTMVCEGSICCVMRNWLKIPGWLYSIIINWQLQTKIPNYVSMTRNLWFLISLQRWLKEKLSVSAFIWKVLCLIQHVTCIIKKEQKSLDKIHSGLHTNRPCKHNEREILATLAVNHLED